MNQPVIILRWICVIPITILAGIGSILFIKLPFDWDMDAAILGPLFVGYVAIIPGMLIAPSHKIATGIGIVLLLIILLAFQNYIPPISFVSIEASLTESFLYCIGAAGGIYTVYRLIKRKNVTL